MTEAAIARIAARAFEIPTDAPEADGTLAWDKTTLVLVEIDADGNSGLGYTYADSALAPFIDGTLAPIVSGRSAFDIPGAIAALWRGVRNLGRPGLAAMAISAIDLALWDLKAKLLGVPLTRLLGCVRQEIAVYGSGGFTSYSDDKLEDQLAGWVEREGCRWVKMKIGSDPERDPTRVQRARHAIGNRGLFVDANGAFTAKRALDIAQRLSEYDVAWFEEPVSSDDIDGLDLMREHGPAGMEIAAGEYGYTLDDFRRLITRPSIDVLQADVTRCGGISGLLQAAALADAHHIDLSAHCAPAAHLHVACASPRLRHQEWFHDHVRIERLLFDGAPVPHGGMIAPDLSRPGLGLAFKERDAESYRVR
ncbi:MAG TPA: enolase C-terminal domain-like protein [Alphaproteobacteria bacterium]|nr:enolase C-terminal domain-like protein [Alphaproteobacteria bacterium]